MATCTTVGLPISFRFLRTMEVRVYLEQNREASRAVARPHAFQAPAATISSFRPGRYKRKKEIQGFWSGVVNEFCPKRRETRHHLDGDKFQFPEKTRRAAQALTFGVAKTGVVRRELRIHGNATGRQRTGISTKSRHHTSRRRRRLNPR